MSKSIPVRDVTTEPTYQMVRRLLFLAFCWNDHNFEAAHIEARNEAAKWGINSMEDAQAFLDSI